MKKSLLLISLFGIFILTGCGNTDKIITSTNTKEITETNDKPIESTDNNPKSDIVSDNTTDISTTSENGTTLPEYTDDDDWKGTIF